ncbi:MAG: FAD-binding oxidoreductase [Polyangiaceae bacterium]|jgi:glycine oxidase|nr:FAD-binding oxidoreductase [Polyangiaceae bacterium]
MQVEVAVIGGGINGLAIAHKLASLYGATVAVFDDGRLGAASRAAAGFLGAQTEGAALPASVRSEIFPLLRQSRLLHEFLDSHLHESVGLGSGYRCTGALHVARDERELEALVSRYGWQREQGAQVVVLSAREARALEPSLSPSIAGAVYLPDEAAIDPGGLLSALRRACDELGVLSISERARQLVCEGGRVSGVLTDGGVYAVDAVVVAAGGWLSGLGGMPHALAPVQPRPARTVLLGGGAGRLGHVVLSGQGYIVPWVDGSLALGSTADAGDASEDMLQGLYAAASSVPELASRPIRHICVGYRPHAPGGLPWVGRVGAEGLFVATGNVRNGMLLAPLAASLVGDLVGGRTRDGGPFAPPAACRP